MSSGVYGFKAVWSEHCKVYGFKVQGVGFSVLRLMV